MTKKWPPSALVEDEKVSLAREYGLVPSDVDSEKDQAPPGSQGSVDQYPIILDVSVPVESPKGEDKRYHHPASHQKEAISTHTNDEKRFLYVPRPSNNAQTSGEKVPPGPASACTAHPKSMLRGRPQVSRIHTDLRGDDSRSQETGQQSTYLPHGVHPRAAKSRAYSHRELRPSLQPSLLQRGNCTRGVPEGSHIRSQSLHPSRLDQANTAIESSDSDSKPRKPKHRSKSRVRQSQSRSEYHHSADEYGIGRTEGRNSRHHQYDKSSPEIVQPSIAGYRLHRGHGSAHDHLTPPETPSMARESPYSSPEEDWRFRRSRDTSRHRQRDSRSYRDSPPTSAPTEEGSRTRVRGEGSESQKPSPASINPANRLHLNLHDVRLTDHPKLHSPGSARTPKIIGDDLQRAFEENQNRLPKYRSAPSSRPSPLSSPARSPPQMDHRCRDYFEYKSQQTSSPKQHSRPPSINESQIKPPTSMLSAAIGGSMSSKAMGGFPRSTPSPLDSPSSRSPSTLPSGQPSRRHSPTPGEPNLGSRGARTVVKEETHSPRPSSYVPQYDYPVAPPSLFAGFDEHAPPRVLTHAPQSGRPRPRAGTLGESHSARASGVILHQDRPSAGNGSYVSGSTTLPTTPTQMTPSYYQVSSLPSLYDQSRLRPSQRRSYSSTNGAVVMPSSSQHPHPSAQPHHTYHLATGKTTISSPSSSTNRGQLINFPKCPHATPVKDIGHWYTIRGLPQFFICTTCIQVEGGFVLRDYCVPNAGRAPNEEVVCSLSKPWIRIAIARFLQEKMVNIPLVDSLNRLPDQTLPCPGKNSDVRKWYHITDPTTKSPVPGSDCCGACVRSAEIIFPELRQQNLFERPADKLVQERHCMLSPASKHFYQLVNELEKLAGYIRKNDLRGKDIVKFGELIMSKSKYKECQKDTMLATPLWHFIRALPEFTICEECYEEVVWPLRDKSIARDVQKTLQPVPANRPGVLVSGISCYLYSERMRQVFHDAVGSGDFAYLKRVTLNRFMAEQQLQCKHKALMEDMAKGIDRCDEAEKVIAEWKAFE